MARRARLTLTLTLTRNRNRTLTLTLTLALTLALTLTRRAGLLEAWQRRDICNFDYLMELNTLAG